MRQFTNADMPQVVTQVMTNIRPSDNSKNGFSDSKIGIAIVELYLKRTREHIESVRKYALRIAELYPGRRWADILVKNVEHHDEDKLSPDIIGDYAPYIVFRYSDNDLSKKFDLTEEYKHRLDTEILVAHCKQSKHHPEYWDRNYGLTKFKPPYVPQGMDEANLAEMCADWFTVGHEQNNTALSWYQKTNKDKRWLWSATQAKFIEDILSHESQVVDPNLSFKEESSIHPNVAVNIEHGLVYHGSPVKLPVLKKEAMGKWYRDPPGVFVSPFKSIAMCFTVGKDILLDELEKQGCDTHSINFEYDVWLKDLDDLRQTPDIITIRVRGAGNYKPFTGITVGYIYTIDYNKYKKKAAMFSLNPESDVEFMIRDDVTPIKTEQIKIKYEVLPPLENSTEQMVPYKGKDWNESMINSVKDLKSFYKDCRYGLVINGRPWAETHNSGQLEEYDKYWRLQTTKEILASRCGTCWDTAILNHYFFTKWGMQHKFYFSASKRSAVDDKYADDPTHAFVVYKDTDNKWKWIEGSWGTYVGNNWEDSSAENLMHRIAEALANYGGHVVDQEITEITSFPPYGCNTHTYCEYMWKRNKHVYDTFYEKVQSNQNLMSSEAMHEALSYSVESIPVKYQNLVFETSPVKKKVYDMARRYYDDTGSHGYEHIREVLATAYVLKGKKDLTDSEYTAILYHDVGRKFEDESKGKFHNVISEQIARKDLPKLGVFTEAELEDIYKAVLYHRDSWRREKGITDSMLMPLAQLVANADKGFPQTTFYDICLRPTLWILEGNDATAHPDKMSRLHNYSSLVDVAVGVKETLDRLKKKRFDKNDTSLHARVFAKEKAMQIHLSEIITIKDIMQVVRDVCKNYNYKVPDDKPRFEIYGAILGCFGKNADMVKYTVTENLPGDPWVAVIKSSNLVTPEELYWWHEHHVIDVDKKGVPYYFIVKDYVENKEYVWYTDDAKMMPINTPQEIAKAKEAGRRKNLVEEQLDFDSTSTESYSTESVLPFPTTGIYKEIEKRARPHYNATGKNSWVHIQRVFSQATRICRFTEKRDLNPNEYAAVLFHDSSVKTDVDKKGHAGRGAKIAERELADIFSKKDLDDIVNAIAEHDDDIDHKSTTADILASGDYNPPDPIWILNKGYEWCIKNKDKIEHDTHETRIDHLVNDPLSVKTTYGSKSKRTYPRHYYKYFGKKIKEMNEFFDNLTYEQADKLIKEYRKKHHLGPNEIGEPEPSVEQLLFSTESLSISTEAAASIKEKRKKIEEYIISSMKLLDKHTDVNVTYWKNFFSSLSDTDFDKFMNCLKDGSANIHMYVPPLKVKLRNSELIEAAHKLGVKLMHRIWMTDAATGMRYLTPEEYLVIQLPVRRQQQFLDEKISVPDDDKAIDGLTGQVTGDSKACAITNPEIHIMQARNLDASLYEFANVRGGNIHNYAEFKRSLEETGSVSLNQLDPNNKTRVSVMGQVLLTGMGLDVNIAEI